MPILRKIGQVKVKSGLFQERLIKNGAIAMDDFKIEHFERDNPGVKFPWFKKLTDEETTCIRNRLIKKLGLPENLSSRS